MAKVLVVGGAGYVGSTTSAWLLDAGHDVWVLDDLSTGYKELILTHQWIQAQAGDLSVVAPLLEKQKFDCIMYFAARSLVHESIQKPDEYLQNNVIQTRALLKAALQAGTKNFVYSSTCAIFGIPSTPTLDESAPKCPMNPYGETKLQIENEMEKLSKEKGLRSIALRYFNAAGAEPKLRVGECHDPETHLIPRVLRAAKQRKPVEIYGNQYSTPDGTCVRDYIHVWDLAHAHESAMKILLQHPSDNGHFDAFNLGSERGFSVREITEVCQKVTGIELEIHQLPPREGDPPRLVANSKRARETLGFTAENSDIHNMIQSAWQWEKKRSSSKKPGIFLDRDGTLNEDPGYLNDPSKLKLFPRVGEALARLKQHGYALVVVSNQSGVGRGLIKENDLIQVHQKLDELLQPWNVSIDHFELCYHHPDDDCECRKPKPKLLIDAAKSLQIDLSRSYMIGDKASDLEAGQAAGCQGAILVRTGEGQNTEADLKSQSPAFIADSLLQAVEWVLSQGNANS